MAAFSDMASSVFECLDFTWDSPVKNSNGRMPVLDMEMWVGTEAREVGIPKGAMEDPNFIPIKTGVLQEVVLFSFYKKPMSNTTPNLRASTSPE